MPLIGVTLLCFPAVLLCAGAFLADFNETHVYNPNWPPHARFHNGQTMSMAAALGAATLWYAIRSAYLPTPTQKRDSLFTAAIIGSMYAITGLSAILYPGSAGCDPGLCGPEGTFVQKYVFGPPLLVTWIGYALEAKKMVHPVADSYCSMPKYLDSVSRDQKYDYYVCMVVRLAKFFCDDGFLYILLPPTEYLVDVWTLEKSFRGAKLGSRVCSAKTESATATHDAKPTKEGELTRPCNSISTPIPLLQPRTMEQYLREWRKNALNKNQHEAAIFIGDKLLALTNSDGDAYWLAQAHFSTGNYTRALSFLHRADLTTRDASARYFAALCLIRQSKFEDALSLLGDVNPTQYIKAPGSARRKLQHGGRNGNANGLSRDGKALQRIDPAEDRMREDVATTRAEAAMCYLRGQCHAKQNAFDRAKECYKVAVRIDVQCFEAFDALMKNSLMTPAEEWDFLQSLDFDTIVVGDGSDPSASQEAAEFTKLLYTTRLGKYGHRDEFAVAIETLSTHYKLASNPDIALSKATHFFTQCRFREALELTTSVLDQDPHNFPTMPIHLACLYELGQKNLLYLISHKLADSHPEEPCTYLAIGVYYLSINQIASARRFFSKASILDPHFGPAWIGFAHTFAHEGEHDQAISAYSTATRLFQGTHLPNMFLGMQNLQLGNLKLAKDYLEVSKTLCSEDPLLLNELGVVFYQEGDLPKAIEMFETALGISADVGSSASTWISTRANLGHALRRLGHLNEALDEFNQVLREGGKDAATFSAKGLVLMEMNNIKDAMIALHEALALAPQDPVATDLLTRAMAAMEEEPVMDERVGREFDRRVEEIKPSSLRGRRGKVRRLRGQQAEEVHSHLGEGESMVVDEDD
ncbi:hypothetical protein BLS_007707 [Venturia inaequalis]|uniref:Anaphase-promoting complex subunit cut9 n=1 Tax=Venturia inaequalis TaxID=5025 RepID=A0A8H3V1D3_VENIN|nr:hypothetical protein BLS_007707 [Venturia inaequalis]